MSGVDEKFADSREDLVTKVIAADDAMTSFRCWLKLQRAEPTEEHLYQVITLAPSGMVVQQAWHVLRRRNAQLDMLLAVVIHAREPAICREAWDLIKPGEIVQASAIIGEIVCKAADIEVRRLAWEMLKSGPHNEDLLTYIARETVDDGIRSEAIRLGGRRSAPRFR